MTRSCPNCHNYHLYLAVAEMAVSDIADIIYCSKCDSHFYRNCEEEEWQEYSPCLNALKNLGCTGEIYSCQTLVKIHNKS